MKNNILKDKVVKFFAPITGYKFIPSMMMGDSFLLHSELIYGQRLTIVHTIVQNGGLLVLVTEKVYHRNDVRKNFTEFYL